MTDVYWRFSRQVILFRLFLFTIGKLNLDVSALNEVAAIHHLLFYCEVMTLVVHLKLSELQTITPYWDSHFFLSLSPGQNYSKHRAQLNKRHYTRGDTSSSELTEKTSTHNVSDGICNVTSKTSFYEDLLLWPILSISVLVTIHSVPIITSRLKQYSKVLQMPLMDYYSN